MDIRVSGHQIDTGSALQAHVEERLAGIVEKYFDRAIASHVTLGKAPAGAFGCDIVMHVMQGLILKSQADAHNAQIGRASCRGRVCQYVYISVVAVSLKQKQTTYQNFKKRQ